MAVNYDNEIKHFEQQARQAREEENACISQVQQKTTEIQQCEAEIGRLEQQKRMLQQQSAQANQGAQMYQQPATAPGAPPMGNPAGVNQGAATSGLQNQITKIDKKIQELQSKIQHLQTEISFLQNQKIPAAKAQLSQALNGLNQLKAQQAQLGNTYQRDESTLRQTRMQDVRQAQTHIDRGAGIAGREYQKTQQRVNYINQIIGQYSSSPNMGTSIGIGSIAAGQYSVNRNPSNNYSAISGNSIDGLVNSYINGNSDNTSSWINSSVNSLTLSLFGKPNRSPGYSSSVIQYYQSNWSGLDY